MTAVALPAVIKEADVVQRLIDFGATLTPPIGGAAQRIGRLGSRFAVDITLPPLADSAARTLLAALAKGVTEASTFTLTWPQPTAASLGTPLVNGGSQAGTSLICDGFTASIDIPAWTFFSFVMGGRKYLHVVDAAVTANGSGQATLSIAPMLRVSPTDNLALEFVNPVIEGFLDDATVGWTLQRLKHRSTRFTLTENE